MAAELMQAGWVTTLELEATVPDDPRMPPSLHNSDLPSPLKKKRHHAWENQNSIRASAAFIFTFGEQ